MYNFSDKHVHNEDTCTHPAVFFIYMACHAAHAPSFRYHSVLSLCCFLHFNSWNSLFHVTVSSIQLEWRPALHKSMEDFFLNSSRWCVGDISLIENHTLQVQQADACGRKPSLSQVIATQVWLCPSGVQSKSLYNHAHQYEIPGFLNYRGLGLYFFQAHFCPSF